MASPLVHERLAADQDLDLTVARVDYHDRRVRSLGCFVGAARKHAAFVGDLVLDQSMPSRRARLTIVDARDLSPSVRGLVLEAIDGPFEWTPGQYVQVRAPDDPNLDLPLSIASAPDPSRPGRFELAVMRGTNTEALLALEPGAEIEARGPQGSFTRAAADPLPALLVGAGTGVAPLRAMIQDELRSAGVAPLVLLFGCRSEADMLWREEFEALAVRAPRFRFEPTLSAPSAAWAGRSGWVQEHLIELGRELGAPQAYVCGGDEMVKDCVLLLEQELDLPPESIFIEQY